MGPSWQNLIDSLEAMWVHFRTFHWAVQALLLGLLIGFAIVVLAPAPLAAVLL